MKIISWNVNGLRAVEKKDFVPWLLSSGADVVCIQETKAAPEQLSKALLSPGAAEKTPQDDAPLFSVALQPSSHADLRYHSYFSSAKKAGYSGTALYSLLPADNIEHLGKSEFDDEGRVTIAYFSKRAIISAYFPNSQGQGLRLPYKLSFCEAIFAKCNELVQRGYEVILCGDYNIAHTPLDIANPKANEKNAGYLPEERAWMDFFTTHGYTDTFRLFCKDGGHYSWWSYRQNAREKNIGWRIDYICVNNALVPAVTSSTILSTVFGSDHCPVAVELTN